ncbi:hypothetical protein M1843_16430 [Isoptericola sp. 4D.3]|uniref:Uncharacterized protein n=1 Tax=Isoptericola peretonis TaxID=2918523 RepID=A0ABT0J761_9MICO|nr:hypothetical protein [Isoptericola sp. 4D.3]
MAQVFGDSTTGFVVFRVEPRWTRTGGFLWWTRWARGVEHVEFVETLWLNADDAPDPDKAVGEAGSAESSSPWLDELRNGSYGFDDNPGDAEHPGQERKLSVRWLAGPERTNALREWGFGTA